ncbi:MAG TPA: RTX toxin, partial [Myxococcaceae bacterium]|nr:RTX toxin [Myxococcaceae bacterium]
YAWSFTPEGSVTPEPAFATQANPTTLHNYSAALQGTLTLEVTDADGGKTTVHYALTPNQFPDDASEMGLINTLVAGSAHTCALLNDGNVRCWGLNDYGQLGYGHKNNIGDNERPYTAGNLQLGDGVVQLAAGSEHTCALLRSGYVRCWGRNQYGQLGYGHVQSVGDDEALLSQSYVNLGARAVRLAAGDSHTCALLTTGKVRCWGYNNYGQLGYAHTQNVGDDEGLWDVSDVQVGGSVQDLVAGASHTCALLTGGRVRCWGYNGYGQLGYGNATVIGDTEHPSSAGDVNVGGTVLQLSTSYHQTCALLDTGSVRCWGYNGYGQLGYGHATNLSSPGADIALGARALQVTAGGYHTCALLSSGQVKCWGYNGHGELGYSHTTVSYAPSSAPLNLGGATAYALTAGFYHTCALLSSGQALCWGYNANGRLGYGHTASIGDDELPFTSGEVALLDP